MGSPGEPRALRCITARDWLDLGARAIDNARVSAWPIEELLFRPVVTVLLALALPFATARVLTVLLAPSGMEEADGAASVRVAMRVVRWIDAAVAGVLGGTALAPALASSGWASAAMGGLAFALSLGASVLAARRLERASAAPMVHPSAARAAFAAALVVGLALPLIAVLVERVTRVPADAIASTSADAARRRLRIDPSDGAAMLATAWSSADHNDLALANLRVDEAARMGAPPAELAEARAEIAARGGDCAAARAHFDRALELRAEVAFERGALELGGYHLPPSLITRCDADASGAGGDMSP